MPADAAPGEMTDTSVPELYPIVNGAPRAGGPASELRSPWDGALVARVHEAGDEDMEAALAAATAAFATTRESSRAERAGILERMSAGVAAARQELADAMVRSTGKPVTYALAEVDRAVSTLRWGAEEARRLGGELVPIDAEPRGAGYSGRLERFPVGVVAAIAPFNFPLNLVVHKVAPALAAGNTVIVKPPAQSPQPALLLAAIAERAGAVRGSVNVLPCPPAVAEKMATDPRVAVLSFTGSARVGWHLKGLANTKRVILELGGNAGSIVHADADLARAARQCAVGAFAQAGQVCIKVQRIFVERSVAARFIELLLAETAALPVGDPADPATVVGPMIDEASLVRVLEWIGEARAAGAQMLCGGERRGSVLLPTILTGVRRDLRVCAEEVFGPVLVVEIYDDFDAALAAVDDSRYGLQAGLFTYDVRRIERAFRRLRVGALIVGDVPTFRVDHMPYGGEKDSGFGREGLRYSIEAMTEPRLLVVKTH